MKDELQGARYHGRYSRLTIWAKISFFQIQSSIQFATLWLSPFYKEGNIFRWLAAIIKA
jgi:hypothetical protein